MESGIGFGVEHDGFARCKYLSRYSFADGNRDGSGGLGVHAYGFRDTEISPRVIGQHDGNSATTAGLCHGFNGTVQDLVAIGSTAERPTEVEQKNQ